MQVNLKPCPYRLVDNEGRILCNQIKSGDRQISPGTCQVCPVAQIDCTHLRAALNQQSRVPLIVRWGNGKSEIWGDPTPPLILERAACSVLKTPILSPRDCVGCILRQALITPDATPLMPKRAPTQSLHSSPNTSVASQIDGRTNIVAQKITQIQAWLAQKKTRAGEEEESGVLPIAFGARSARSVIEEKRVGWTD